MYSKLQAMKIWFGQNLILQLSTHESSMLAHVIWFPLLDDKFTLPECNINNTWFVEQEGCAIEN